MARPTITEGVARVVTTFAWLMLGLWFVSKWVFSWGLP